MTSKQSSNYDPSKAVWNGTSINDWEPSQWKQWKPKATGSPTDYCATAEREYLRMRYSIQQVNDRLDADKARIKLKLSSPRAIALQGTFPCKSGDIGKNGSPNKQYIISLGIAANDAGVKTAEAKARELDLLLMTKQFQWTPDLLGKQAQKTALPDEKQPAKLISELIEEYEKEFWKTHEKDRKGINTWYRHYQNPLNRLPLNLPLSDEALIKALESTKPNSDSRMRVAWQLKKFCNFCNYDGSKIIESYNTGSPQRKKRNVPNDNEILEGFYKIGTPLSIQSKTCSIQPEQWQWVYGMLATYGLKPHELFAIDLEAFTDLSNIHHLVTLKPELTDGTKTGERNCGIPPLHPEWVELFNLKNIKPVFFKRKDRAGTENIDYRFTKTNIGFHAYDLRHAYAIRGHRLRIPVKTMADYMGHTVQEHTKTYQRWMSKDTNLEIYKEVVLEKQATTKEDLKAENEFLKTRLAKVEAENERLRAWIAEYQLDANALQ